MSKRETKISLFGSAENENISIVVDEDSKMINILRQNANRTYQETYRLDSVNVDIKNIKTDKKETKDNMKGYRPYVSFDKYELWYI